MYTTSESLFESYLGVNTVKKEKDFAGNRNIFNGYAPTKYYLLEQLFNRYPFNADDHFIDFGCGMGRVMLMAALYSCKRITGYEIDGNLYRLLLINIEQYQKKFGSDCLFDPHNQNVEFVNIEITANKLFFFNPFHFKVYFKLLKKIYSSFAENKREITMFLHTPNETTIRYIDSMNIFHKVESLRVTYTNTATQKDYYEYVVYKTLVNQV